MDGLALRSCGPLAAIVDCNPEHTLSIAAALRATDAFIDVVPAESSVFVSSAQTIVPSLLLEVAQANAHVSNNAQARLVEIPVRYNGADLEEVAELTGLKPVEVIELHSSTIFTAAFAGFAPGFMYCTGLPDRLKLPRRKNPRVSVPAGSVAIADIYSAVYPLSSPGGWHLLGTTDVPMFDLHREPASFMQPGDSVKYVRVD